MSDDEARKTKLELAQSDNQTHLSPEQLKQIEEDERELRAIMLD
jgi:hypothetical protein